MSRNGARGALKLALDTLWFVDLREAVSRRSSTHSGACRNGDPQAARVGTTETTTQSAKYFAHRTFGSIFIHKVPGAGTRRFPSRGFDRERHKTTGEKTSKLVLQFEDLVDAEVPI